MRTTISSKGQIVLPVQFRRMDGIRAGQVFDVERIDSRDYRPVSRAAPPNEGALERLLACPRQGFLTPIDSEPAEAL
jgi:bifunctional DNA-binding transcriptional regulator/antitoxin component of YhaV-PrlF toxin-antitoxin module